MTLAFHRNQPIVGICFAEIELTQESHKKLDSTQGRNDVAADDKNQSAPTSEQTTGNGDH